MFMFYKVDITWYTVSELVSFFTSTQLQDALVIVTGFLVI